MLFSTVYAMWNAPMFLTAAIFLFFFFFPLFFFLMHFRVTLLHYSKNWEHLKLMTLKPLSIIALNIFGIFYNNTKWSDFSGIEHSNETAKDMKNCYNWQLCISDVHLLLRYFLYSYCCFRFLHSSSWVSLADRRISVTFSFQLFRRLSY